MLKRRWLVTATSNYIFKPVANATAWWLTRCWWARFQGWNMTAAAALLGQRQVALSDGNKEATLLRKDGWQQWQQFIAESGSGLAQRNKPFAARLCFLKVTKARAVTTRWMATMHRQKTGCCFFFLFAFSLVSRLSRQLQLYMVQYF